LFENGQLAKAQPVADLHHGDSSGDQLLKSACQGVDATMVTEVILPVACDAARDASATVGQAAVELLSEVAPLVPTQTFRLDVVRSGAGSPQSCMQYLL